MFNIYTYLYYANIKPIGSFIMIYLFIVQVVLFCILIANVAKLFINLLIDKQ